jgi:hypothetical protein
VKSSFLWYDKGTKIGGKKVGFRRFSVSAGSQISSGGATQPYQAAAAF